MDRDNNFYWIFHSKVSGSLNLLSHWIIIILLSIVFSFIATIIYECTNTLSALTEYHDWINSSNPELNDYIKDKGRFDKALTALITKITNTTESNTPLSVNDQSCVSSEPSSGHTVYDKFSLFGQIPVNPICTQHLPDKVPNELTDEEKNAFFQFSSYMKEEVTKILGSSSENKNIEEIIAKLFGLDGINKNLSFVIPWVYVASENGAIIIAPAPKSFEIKDTKARPWYKIGFGSQPDELSEKTGIGNDRLSLLYLDEIAGKHRIYVRTYIRNFEYKEKKFVVDIDITLSKSELSEFENYLDWLNKNSYFIHPSSVHFSFFIFAIFCFWITRRGSSFFNVYYTFEKEESPKYGLFSAQTTTTRVSSSAKEISKNRGIGIKTRFLDVTGKNSKTERIKHEQEDTNIVVEPGLRGVEYWNVYKDTYLTWRSFSFKFEHIEIQRIGVLKRKFNKDVQPNVDWSEFNSKNFSENVTKQIKGPLIEVLGSHPESYTNDKFKVQCDLSDVSRLCSIPSIPDWVNSLSANISESLSPQYCRAYLTVNKEQLRDFYSNHHIEVLISSGYLSRLLIKEQTEFLTRGKTIDRIVSFGSKSSKLILTSRAKTLFNKILQENNNGQRKLRRIDVNDKEKLLPLFDFAILDGKYIIVTQSIDETILVDPVTGSHSEKNIQLSCYVSWRESDKEYFKAIFRRFSSHARNFEDKDVTIQPPTDD